MNNENNNSKNSFMSELLEGYGDTNNNSQNVVNNQNLQQFNGAQNNSQTNYPQGNNTQNANPAPSKYGLSPELKKQTINDLISKSNEVKKVEQPVQAPVNNDTDEDIEINISKTKIIIALVVIVLLVGVGIFVKKKLSGPEPIIEKKRDILLNDIHGFTNNGSILIDDASGNGFSYMKIKKKDNDYFVLTKKKSYLIENNALTVKYSGLQFPVTLESGELVNKEEGFSISIINDKYTFKSPRNSYSIFNGKYVLYNANVKDQKFEMPKINDGKHTGFYTSSEKDDSIICLIYNKSETTVYKGKQYYDYGYYISGYVRDNKEDYTISPKKLMGMPSEDSDSVLSGGYYLIFDRDNLKLNYAYMSNGKIIYEKRIVDGNYKKIKNIPYKDMMEDIEKNVILVPFEPIYQ